MTLVAWLKHSWKILEKNFFDRRPWGEYRTVDYGQKWALKVIRVRPGGRLSLQKHSWRSETWIVAEGVATMEVGGLVRVGEIGSVISIAVGAEHRLSNGGSRELVLIEVQFGDPLLESDIIRIADDYGRR